MIRASQQSILPQRATAEGDPVRTASVPDVLEQRIALSFSYPVHFTHDLFGSENPVLARSLARVEPHRRHRCLVVVDDGVAKAWPQLGERIAAYASAHASTMELVAPPLIMPGGEGAKNDSYVTDQVVGKINEHGIDRQSYVICIGGGSLLDSVGYAAAIAHRGVRLIRVPTTVLSQNDSGVGVKNGINAFGKKNFTGTFAPPFAVLNDLDFLTTLSPELVRAGMSEAVKVALIKDAAFFEWMENHRHELVARDAGAIEYLVKRCAQLHLHHIASSGDPFEVGSARPLDFGHWSAHKLESLSKNRVGHGDAVATGIALDTLYAQLIGLLEQPSAERITALLEGLGFELWDDALDARDDSGSLRVMSGITEFREHLGGELSITLLRGIGHGMEAHEIDRAVMERALERLRERHLARCG